MKLTDFKTTKERREFLEKKLAINLKSIGQVWRGEDEKKVHCENRIGGIRLPLGVVGPLKVQSPKSKVQSYYIPLATTEGALVASANRGCKAIREAGGATSFADRVGATRGPVFETAGISESMEVRRWLTENFAQIAQIA